LVDNSREAVDRLYQSRDQRAIFDVVMIDYFMPGMDSLELSEILNTHPDFQCIPKITLSSYNLAEQEREIANIEICLTKPIRENMLKDILLECVNIKNQTAHNNESTESSLLDDLLVNTTDILLAEDNHVNALIAVTMMEQIGLSVKHVTDGQQAVNEVKNNHYKLVLMDMHMPVMDGYKATQNIRQWEEQSELEAIPIIALTANALAGDKEKCLKAGMDDYLPKPVKQIVLQKVVAKWAGKEAA
jgi:CheY-like chemotaxis protein